VINIYVFRQTQQYFIVQVTGNNFRSLDHPLKKLSTLDNFHIRTVHLDIINVLLIHQLNYPKRNIKIYIKTAVLM